jgi:hypothetical protein
LAPSWPSTAPPVDTLVLSGHALEHASDHLGMRAATLGKAELPEFLGSAVVLVDGLIEGVGIDLVGRY